MEKITVSKTDLLAIVKANRDKHRAIFLEALEGYQRYALELLRKHIADMEVGKTQRVYISVDRPEDHTRDYDRIIAMLEMDQGDTFTLTEQDFAQYALDDWKWKRQWGVSNSGYVTASTRTYATDYFEDTV